MRQLNKWSGAAMVGGCATFCPVFFGGFWFYFTSNHCVQVHLMGETVDSPLPRKDICALIPYIIWDEARILQQPAFIYGSQQAFNPLTAGAAYIRVFIFILAHQVSPFEHVKDKMWHQSAIFENRWPPCCQIWIIFTHLKLWIASARHNLKWVKIQTE